MIHPEIFRSRVGDAFDGGSVGGGGGDIAFLLHCLVYEAGVFFPARYRCTRGNSTGWAATLLLSRFP